MKIKGLVAVAALAFTLLNVAPSEAQNQPVDIYSDQAISQITITLSDNAAGKIERAPKTSVPARFAMTNDSGTLNMDNLPIDFHLKGTSTLQQNPSLVSSRPSLRVKFHQNGKIKIPFRGKSLTLNSMTQDQSKVHEYTAYKLYNAMGVPAPRVGYANVTVIIGGRSYDKGLFAIIEPYDDLFLQRNLANHTQHLYEPCKHWTDVTKPGASKGTDQCDNAVFEVKEGWKKVPNKLDLRALSSIQKLADNAEWWQAMDRYTDRDEFIRMWAVDNFVSAWDSYSGAIINNYYLRSDSMGVFSMLPTGADETFEYNFKMDATSIGYPLIYDNFGIQTKGRGIMFTRCLNYNPCRNQYLDTLRDVKDKAASIKLKDSVDQIGSMLNGTPTWGQIAVKNWIDMKSNDVDALLKKYGR